MTSLKEERDRMKKNLLFVMTLTITLALAMPAMAFHLEPSPGLTFDFYATNNFQTEYRFTDREDSANDEEELQWDISNTFGAMMKYKNFVGKLEMGFKFADNNDDIYSRLLYGTYSFNDTFKLSMGQMYDPNYWWTYSNTKAGNAGTGYGIAQSPRTPQIRVDIGPAYVIAARVFESTPATVSAAASDVSTVRKIPRMMVGFDTSIDRHKVGAGIGYNSHTLESATLSMDTTLESWIAFVHGQVSITDNIFLKSQVFYAQNAPQYGLYGHGSRNYTGTNETSAEAQWDGSDGIEDSKTWAGFLHVKAKLGDGKAIFAGYGYSSSENDMVNGGEKNPKQEYYVGGEIDVYESGAAKMYVVPEIHMFDHMDDESGNDEGSDLYAGARWKLKF